MDQNLLDQLELRQLIDNWAIWRDAGFWEKFRTVWHDDGRMMATWTQGTADEFIEMNKQGWAKGVSILHFLGGHTAEIVGDRAITQTKMTISQRGEVHGIMCDVVCTGRFYDFLENAMANGACACVNRFTRKIGWILWNREKLFLWNQSCLSSFPLVTATSPIFKAKSVILSKKTCLASRETWSKVFMQREKHGWRVALSNGRDILGANHQPNAFLKEHHQDED